MSQDIVADALNQIMNAKKAGKTEVELKHHSKFLISVLALAKLKGYIKSYKVDETNLNVVIGKINGCKSIKPRFTVKVDQIAKYVKRYLPAKNLGVIIISTSQGLMAHDTAQEKEIGGSLIAYLY
jgi:small subunit ribosomal protein S8